MANEEYLNGWRKEIDTQSKVVEKAISGINMNAADAASKVDAVSKLVKEVASNRRYYAEAVDAEAKNSLEDERNDIERAKVETDNARNEIEFERNEKEAKTAKWKLALMAVCAFIPAILTFIFDIFKEKKRDKRFYVASGFEDENAYLKRSQTKAVDDALKDNTEKHSNTNWNAFR